MHYVLVQGAAVIDARNVAADQSTPPAPVGCQWIADPTGQVAPGWSYSNGSFAAPATPATTPAQLCDQITALRDDRLETGFADTGSGMTGKTWQCDPISVSRWDALATQAYIAVQAGKGATTVPLIAADNTINEMSYNDIYALLAMRVAPWVQATIVYARTMKNSVVAGNPPADITQGWP